MTFARPYAHILIIFLLALSVRIAFLPFPLFSTVPFDGQSVAIDGYKEVAESLLAGNGFSRSAGPPIVPDSVRTPLYPLMIAGILYVIGSYKIFLLLQILIGSTIPLLGKKLAEMLTGNKPLALGVGIFLALEPFTAWVSTVILTETYFAALFLAGFITFLSFLQTRRARDIVFTAILWGLATLIKPTPQYLPILFTIIILFKEWRPSAVLIKQLAAFLAIFFLVLSPWMYRNYVVFGNPNLNVQMISSLYVYLVPSAIAFEEGIGYPAAAERYLGPRFATIIEDVNLGNTAHYKEIALRELAKHPLGFIQSALMTGYTFFTHDAYRSFTGNYAFLDFEAPGLTSTDLFRSPGKVISLISEPGVILIGLGRLAWTLIAVLAFIGGFLWLKEERLSVRSLVVTLTILYFAATTIIIGLAINGRFRNPVSTFILVLAGIALLRIGALLKNRFA